MQGRHPLRYADKAKNTPTPTLTPTPTPNTRAHLQARALLEEDILELDAELFHDEGHDVVLDVPLHRGARAQRQARRACTHARSNMSAFTYLSKLWHRSRNFDSRNTADTAESRQGRSNQMTYREQALAKGGN